MIDDRWTETPGHLKTHLENALASASSQTLSPSTDDKKPSELSKDLSYLQSHLQENAWCGQALKAILTAQTDFKSTDYFQLEGPELCLKRLAVLVRTKLYLPGTLQAFVHFVSIEMLCPRENPA